MPKMDIAKSITIKKPAATVFGIVSNLGQWRPWSPWLITEPEAQVEVSSDGKSYSWKGKRTGEGSMKILSEEPQRALTLDLQFLKPWKSQAKVGFQFEDLGEECQITWSMNSSLPFFLFFMKKMMTALIGMDYERGLSMLKDFSETGSVPSQIGFTGKRDFKGSQLIAVTTECAISAIGPKMKSDFDTLQNYMDKNDLKPAGPPLSIYHKWDMGKEKVRYSSGFPLSHIPESLPTEMHPIELNETPCYVLTHTGPYRHLGNAWSTGMQMSRGKEFRQNKKISPFEVYLNDPTKVSENELEVEVHFPVAG